MFWTRSKECHLKSASTYPPSPSSLFPCWLRGCNAWRFIFVSTRVRRLRWAHQPCVYLTSTSQNPPLLQDAKLSLESLHTSSPYSPIFLFSSTPLHSTPCLHIAFPIIRGFFSPLSNPLKGWQVKFKHLVK